MTLIVVTIVGAMIVGLLAGGELPELPVDPARLVVARLHIYYS